MVGQETGHIKSCAGRTQSGTRESSWLGVEGWGTGTAGNKTS